MIDDLVLQEGGIQACVERWRVLGMEALLMEATFHVTKQPSSSMNLCFWLEQNVPKKQWHHLRKSWFALACFVIDTATQESVVPLTRDKIVAFLERRLREQNEQRRPQ